jgi:hypothetical protein
MIFRTFSARFNLILLPRGDALRACPWLSYCAPLALFDLKSSLRPFGAQVSKRLLRPCRCGVKSLHTRRAEALDDLVAVGAGGGFDGGLVEG